MEATAQVPSEIVVLGWGVILFLIQLVIQASAAVLELGLPYAVSARDEGREVKGIFAGRMKRAFQNMAETFVVFAALALALVATSKAGGLGATGAWVWFWARVVYVPAYVVGIPFVRTLVWTVSAIGLVLMLIRLLS